MGSEERTGVYDMRENPSLSDLFAMADRNLRVTIRTSTVVRIAPSTFQPLGYDPDSQLCSVLVQQLSVTVNPDVAQGAKSTTTHEPLLLVNVPVAWPRTKAGYLTFPLVVGDSGELIIQDRSLKEWLKKGFPVDPIDRWTHNRGDGVFHPGLHSNLDKLPATDITATVLDGPPAGPDPLLNLGGVKIGRGAADFAIKGTAVAAGGEVIAAALNLIPPPVDVVTLITSVEGNTVAILALIELLQNSLASKAKVE